MSVASSFGVSSAGGTALSASIQGMMLAGVRLSDAANVVTKATVAALNGVGSDGDTVAISDAGSLEAGLIDTNLSSYSFLANARMVQTSDKQFQAMLDLVVGRRRA